MGKIPVYFGLIIVRGTTARAIYFVAFTGLFLLFLLWLDIYKKKASPPLVIEGLALSHYIAITML